MSRTGRFFCAGCGVDNRLQTRLSASQPRGATEEAPSAPSPASTTGFAFPRCDLSVPVASRSGIVPLAKALELAQEYDLDLVEVAATARPPVCKLMDYGKFKYESAMKAREARKNQAHTVIKEMKLRPKIDPHDYDTKKGHVVRFLKQGDKVKITIMFRGREQSRPELGFRLLQRLAEDVQDLGFVESNPKQDGRNMIMVLGPHKKKTEAMAEAREAQAARKAESPGASPRTAGRRGGREPKPRPRPRPAEPRRPPGARLRNRRRNAEPDALRPRPRPDGGPATRRRRRHAEEQDAQRYQQALQDHRLRQGAAGACRQAPPAGAQAVVQDARPHRHRRGAPSDAKKIKKLLGK